MRGHRVLAWQQSDSVLTSAGLCIQDEEERGYHKVKHPWALEHMAQEFLGKIKHKRLTGTHCHLHHCPTCSPDPSLPLTSHTHPHSSHPTPTLTPPHIPHPPSLPFTSHTHPHSSHPTPILTPHIPHPPSLPLTSHTHPHSPSHLVGLHEFPSEDKQFLNKADLLARRGQVGSCQGVGQEAGQSS